MERKYLNNLLEWMNNEDRKPLLVLGARQVGKTYLVEELFAKNYFKNRYLRIDCSDDKDFVDYVFKNDNLQSVIDYIQIHYNFPLNSSHLLIIDEAQDCLPIVKMMKHFCEKRRDIPLIVSGSLVRIKIERSKKIKGKNNNFLFPVGKINELYIYPLTFDEFLKNYNEKTYEYVLNCFNNKIAINSEIHNEILSIFDDYLFIGGMPEIVDIYIKNKENKLNALNKVVKTIKDLYSNYLSDMELYQASKESIARSRLIYTSIYSQLNKENKNFKSSLIESNLRNRDLLNPLGWLILANIVNPSYLLKEKISTPFIEQENSLFRLYLSDMGLFTFQSELNAKQFVLDKNNVLSGIYYENYLSIELVARGYKLFYWKGKRNSEFEFLLNSNNRIIALDSKKSRGALNSINEFRYHNKKDLIIKVSRNQYGFDKENLILTLPYYYFSFFLNDLDNNIDSLLNQ